MTTFDLKNWMTENRETVITKYNKLTKEEHFNGVTLREFMTQVYNLMSANNIKSAKRAASMLSVLMGTVYADNCRILVGIDRDAAIKSKYEGTAYMALV